MLGYKDKANFLRTYGVILLATVFGFIVRLSKFNEFSFRAQVTIYFVSLVLIVAVWETLRNLDKKLDKVYPYERNITGRIALQLVLGACVGLFARFLIYVFAEPFVPFKLDSLFVATTWALYVLVPSVINLAFFSRYFLIRWRDSLVVAERLEKEKSQVQFDNLKNQLNPHFLFNALTSLNSLIFENQKLASEFLQQLSKVYRYVLQNKDKNFVTLQTELDFIQHYISLLHTRFAGALFISVDIAPEAREGAVVPVTLQILIENALKHNIVDPKRPLKIDILTLGDYLVVSNNLQVRKRVETSNKQGLDNLRSLYGFLTKKELIIEETDTRFAVKIPLLGND